MKKTILLTGAAGFIGGNLLRYLFDKHPSDYFIVLDSLTYAGNQKNISDDIRNSGRFEFWYGDVANPYIVNELMSRVNLVVHLAAETHVARSIFDNTKFYQTDVIGTQVMMNALLKSPQVERFIHISTSEVYGTAEQVPMTEDHPLNPCSPYAGAKAGADRLVYSYWRTYNLPAVILRPFNNYGPRQHLEKLIPRFITSAIKNKPLTVHGDGTAKRDWVFVDDTCRAIESALYLSDFSKINQQVINIGGKESLSILDIVNKIKLLCPDSKSEVVFIGDRMGQVLLHQASSVKAKELLNWESDIFFDEGLKKTIAWYIDNEDWWSQQEWMKCVPIRTKSGTIEMH